MSAKTKLIRKLSDRLERVSKTLESYGLAMTQDKASLFIEELIMLKYAIDDYVYGE